ncbi:fimbria/pilus outer membrane usher protein [Sphingomonas cavernae]|uniref:fimbria/pilus outer membrane usher protein n=1 Tax=Sphingomonas cavernae TaxID=2320861 RepID=UPI0016034DC6|nr:fimbria/pilus outer membrane usher protein [Sphingomonas cavernae]
MLLATVAAFASQLAGVAAAQRPAADETPAAPGIVYLLDVRVNGWPLELVARFYDENGRLSLPAEQFDGLGFKLEEAWVTMVGGQRRVYLDQIPGLSWKLDMRAQAIDITAPFERLKTNELHVSPRPVRIESRADWGMLLGWDIFGEWTPRARDELHGRTVSTNLEARLFSPLFTAAATGFVNVGQGIKTEFVRLDTHIDIDNPDKAWRLRFGDTITAGPRWVRPFRFGGVQWTRDFGLRPDIVTIPVPTLSRDVSVPSTIDLFVDGIHRYSQAVDPGAVRLTDLPVAGGANTIQMVVTDQAGRRSEVVLPVYSSTALLARGMSRFSMEAGVARQNYSIASNDYEGKFAAGTYSYGVTDGLTLTGSVALADGYWSVVGEATVSVGKLFVLDGALLYSDGPAGRGQTWVIGFEHASRRLSLSGYYARASERYFDLAALFGYNRFRERAVASFGLNLGRAGQINLAYVGQREFGPGITSVVSGTYGFDLLRNRVRLSASGYGDTDNESWGVLLSLSVSLGRGNTQAYLQQSWRNDQRSTLAQLRGQAFDQRLNWEVDGTVGDFKGASAQADWDGERADLHFRVDHSNGSTGIQAELMQSLVFMNNQLFLAGRVDDAFTVVEVEDSPGVRVALENRTVGRTNKRGRIFVSGLQSYVPNAVSIEPLDLPVDASIGDPATQVAPKDRAGVVTRFSVKRARSAVVTLQLPDGSAPPPGASALVAGIEEPVLTGFGGEVYVRGLKPGANRLDVTWQGGSCSVTFDADVAAGSLPRLGPFICVP